VKNTTRGVEEALGGGIATHVHHPLEPMKYRHYKRTKKLELDEKANELARAGFQGPLAALRKKKRTKQQKKS